MRPIVRPVCHVSIGVSPVVPPIVLMCIRGLDIYVGHTGRRLEHRDRIVGIAEKASVFARIEFGGRCGSVVDSVVDSDPIFHVGYVPDGRGS